VSSKAKSQAPITTGTEPLVYSVEELAVALTLCTRTVRNLIRTRALVSRKVGRRVLIPRSSVEAFLRKDHSTGEERRAQKRAQ
jgi:excisionase family DNA binding protein